MNYLKFLFPAIFIFSFSTAQNALIDLAKPTLNNNWWRFNESANVSPENFFEKYGPSLNLDESNEMILLEKKEDDLGMTHERYAQYFEDVKVEGAQFLLHIKGNSIVTANGRLVANIPKSSGASISFEQAIERARGYLGAHTFNWESEEFENQIKYVKDDPNATYYPDEELVYADPLYSQSGENYKLAYRLSLYHDGLNHHEIVFIDAVDGSLLYELEGCHTGSANGVAHTKYYGTQSIVTDSLGPDSYVLKDDTRGDGIETFDMFQQTNIGLAQLFHDSDNVWNNFNAQLDEVATDVHWGSEMVYDYFLNVHGRDSYDGNGAKLVSYVHYDSAWFNAGWTGDFMVYGDGDTIWPLTSIDVTGHEIDGVTNFSANLVYAYEPGALNESFSDIFGTAIEHYSVPSSANWLMGLFNFTIRSMEDPNLFNQPATYLADTMYYIGPFDNGGVHINSGVQNFWFYNLSIGGTGTNALGNSYNVDSIGMDKASDISFRNLIYYLTPSSQYYDSRQGSIESAIDLYGNCSFEVTQTIKAWYAVGVGPDTATQDLDIVEVIAPGTSCDLGPQENLTVSFRYLESGCDSIILAGDTLQLSYRLNGGTVISEDFVTTSNINSNDTVTYTFNHKEDLSSNAQYIMDFWTKYTHDELPYNDSIIGFKIFSRNSLTTPDSVTFEVLRIAHEEDFYYLNENENSLTLIGPYARSKGFRGLLMTGQGMQENFSLPSDEAMNFEINPTYESKVCMCVDASSWNNVNLQFDLKQFYSSLWVLWGAGDIPKLVSSIRVMVNDQQIGDQYHPTTNMLDSFMTHSVNLDAFAGQSFELCFEGKHYFNNSDDFTNTVGDRSFIDHIVVSDQSGIGVEELPENNVRLFPNPTNGVFNLEIFNSAQSQAHVVVYDMLGNEVFSEKTDLQSGSNSLKIDLLNASNGVYQVWIEVDTNVIIKQIVLQ